MKQIKTALLMLVVCTLTFSSCKKDSAKTSVSLKVTIDGVTKTASHVVATYYKSENTLQLMATFSGTENVSLMIENVKVGNFDASSDEVLTTYATTNDFANTYTGDSGQVVISTFGNGTISGTFNFVATNTSSATKTLTAGSFNTTYVSQ